MSRRKEVSDIARHALSQVPDGTLFMLSVGPREADGMQSASLGTSSDNPIEHVVAALTLLKEVERLNSHCDCPTCRKLISAIVQFQFAVTSRPAAASALH